MYSMLYGWCRLAQLSPVFATPVYSIYMLCLPSNLMVHDSPDVSTVPLSRSLSPGLLPLQEYLCDTFKHTWVHTGGWRRIHLYTPSPVRNTTQTNSQINTQFYLNVPIKQQQV